jgi:glutathione S-transferase
MALKLYMHPLSSFCHKALIALYENDTAFEPHIVDLGNAEARAEFLKVWPLGKFPVLRDDARDRTVPESTIIIEYLAQHYPGRTALLPPDEDLARQTRLRDRFFDLYVHLPVQQIVGDRLRPAGSKDPFGLVQARKQLANSLGMVEADMATKPWVMGDHFTMADCAAAPALFYANKVMPLAGTYKNTANYLQRLLERPSYARVIREAEPYFHLFPA